MYQFKRILLWAINRGLLNFCSDRIFLSIKYYVAIGSKLNLRKPDTFNEKLQWLKLYDKKPEYTMMVDKYAVRDYIAKTIGEEYLIPLIGVWDKFDDIDFSKLPNQFVLKCTHDSGGVVICKDKSQLDIDKVRKKIGKALKRDFFKVTREYPYKNVKRRIIAEKYMTDGDNELSDYKVHNFNGVPKIILVCRDRYKAAGMTEDFYSEKWEHLDVKRPSYSNAKDGIACPNELEEILELSKALSKDIPFVRTDFYIINHKVYFGEITFYPASGFEEFSPAEWDYKLGSWIKLPTVKNGV